jgi:hypothetical protein
MHLLRKNKKKKQDSSELDIFLTVGMEVFSSLNEKKKKNNNKSNNNEKKALNSDKIQAEAEKKIDALIAEYEKETKSKDIKSKPQKETKDANKTIVETREDVKKNPDMPYLKTADKSEEVFDTLKSNNSKEELLEIKKPKEITEIKYLKEKETFKQKSTSPKIKNYISTMKLPRIKIRSKGDMKRMKKKKNGKKEEEKMNLKKDIKEKKSDKENILYSISEDTQNYKTYGFKEEQNDKIKDKEVGMHQYIINKEDAKKENPLLDEDIKKVLEITDNLLGKLPEEVIDEFIKSKDYELYEKVIKRYKIK